jgi:hypothetical protein
LILGDAEGFAGFVAGGVGRAGGLEGDELVEEPRGGFLAENDAPLGTEFDFEDGAGIDAESVAELLGQSELTFAGDGGFYFLTVK